MANRPEVREELLCVECGRRSEPDAHGWRAYLVDGATGQDEVAVFCPTCASREFGGEGASRS